MKHHQDQDAPRYDVSHIRDLRVKIQNIRKWQPEEFLQMIKDFKTATDGTGTTSATRKIKFLRTM